MNRESKSKRGRRTLPRIVLLYSAADGKAAEWQKLLRHAEREAGRMMREERETRGISLRAMAQMLGVSPPYLSDMELGNRRYSAAWAKAAMDVFKQNTQSPKATA